LRRAALNGASQAFSVLPAHLQTGEPAMAALLSVFTATAQLEILTR